MASFRSLLQGFQAATGTTTTIRQNNDNNHTVESVEERKNKPTDLKSALFDWTSVVWNQTLIRHATSRSRRRQNEHQNQPNESITANSDASISLPSSTSSSKIHLAVCICIVDDLPHENIWRRWIQDATSRVTASVYIHAKHPERIREHGSAWLQQCLIPISHCPNWNDVRIVRAMLSLIEHALLLPTTPSQTQQTQDEGSSVDLSFDHPITHILFATESCIPIAPIQALEQILMLQEQHQSSISTTRCSSFLDYYGKDQATRFEERHCWNVVSQFVPMDCIVKALPGWCLLTAQHALDVLRLSYQHRMQLLPMQDSTLLPPLSVPEVDLTMAFEECWAPEEVYFATALCLLGHIHPTNDDSDDRGSVRRESVVYAEWPPGRRENERAHPKVWDEEFSPQFVARLRQPRRRGNTSQSHRRDGVPNNNASEQSQSSHILFLRKVKHRMPIEKWEQSVLGAATHLSATTIRPPSHQTLSHTSTMTRHRNSSYHQSNYDYSEQQPRARSYSPSIGEKRKRAPRDRHYSARNDDREDRSWTRPSQRQRHRDYR
jgi:hypothetical protein